MTVLVTGGIGYIGSHMVLERRDAGERVIVLENLSTGHDWAIPTNVPLIVGESGDQELVGRLLRDEAVDAIIHLAASIVVLDSVRDPLGYYRNKHDEHAGADRMRRTGRRAQFYFFLDRRGLRQPNGNSGHGKRSAGADLALRLVEADERSDAARCRSRARSQSRHLRYFNVAGADPHGRAGQSSKAATHLIKVAVEAALGLRARLDVFGDDYPTRMGLSSATIFMSAILRGSIRCAPLSARRRPIRRQPAEKVSLTEDLMAGADLDLRFVEAS